MKIVRLFMHNCHIGIHISNGDTFQGKFDPCMYYVYKIITLYIRKFIKRNFAFKCFISSFTGNSVLTSECFKNNLSY